MAARKSRSAASPAAEDLWRKLSSGSVAGAAGESPGDIQAVKAKETFTLVVGQKQSGKTSVITAFTNPSKDDTPKPTTALDYLFARRGAAPNLPKDVAHIWELGGGAKLGDLVSVPISPNNLASSCIVVVVDLSKPENLVQGLVFWLGVVRSHVEDTAERLRDVSKGTTAHDLARRANERLSADHPDRNTVMPLVVPLVIVGAKYDKFKDFESVQKKVVCQALRFIAHMHGATLVMVGARDKASRDTVRAHLTHHLFGTARPKKIETNHEKPLSVPFGSDSFDDVLKPLPKGADASDFLQARGGVQREALDTWGRLLEDLFGTAKLEDSESGVAAAASGAEETKAFQEPAVDEAREERDAVLKKYKKEAARKKRLEAASTKKSSRPENTSSSAAGAASSSSRSRREKSGFDRKAGERRGAPGDGEEKYDPGRVRAGGSRGGELSSLSGTGK